MHKASDQNKRFVLQCKYQSIQSDAPCQDYYFRYGAVLLQKKLKAAFARNECAR